MPRWKLSSPKIPSVIQRYGLAILSVVIGLGIGLLLERSHFHDVEFPLFLLAIVERSGMPESALGFLQSYSPVWLSIFSLPSPFTVFMSADQSSRTTSFSSYSRCF